MNREDIIKEGKDKINAIAKKYDILWTEEIGKQLVLASKDKGFLTTQQLEETFRLLVFSMKL